MAAPMIEASAPPATRLEPRDFDALPGWNADDHGAAFRAFRRSAAVVSNHPPKRRDLGLDAAALSAILARALAQPADLAAEPAKAFFEAEFTPVEIVPESGSGFFTGYYEPIVAGSRTRSARFAAPLYRAPDDLVEFDPAAPPAEIDPAIRFARRTGDGFVPYYDRAEIEAGALSGRGLELVYLADPVDAFFIHIQGAARIELAEGGTMRATYAAKSGHPYTPIGRVLIEMGELEKGKATMPAIRAWLAGNPERAGAIMARNRSFIFFREAVVDDPELGPVAAAKVPLTPGRSLAVDRLLHSFHVPVFVDTRLPNGQDFRRLLVAQDTGSAIVGPARGDIFFGSGDDAGVLAGTMAAAGRFFLLVPRGSALGGGAAR
jgi:membrane-bound lytic murein transglycosylase A